MDPREGTVKEGETISPARLAYARGRTEHEGMVWIVFVFSLRFHQILPVFDIIIYP